METGPISPTPRPSLVQRPSLSRVTRPICRREWLTAMNCARSSQAFPTSWQPSGKQSAVLTPKGEEVAARVLSEACPAPAPGSASINELAGPGRGALPPRPQSVKFVYRRRLRLEGVSGRYAHETPDTCHNGRSTLRANL